MQRDYGHAIAQRGRNSARIYLSQPSVTTARPSLPIIFDTRLQGWKKREHGRVGRTCHNSEPSTPSHVSVLQSKSEFNRTPLRAYKAIGPSRCYSAESG